MEFTSSATVSKSTAAARACSNCARAKAKCVGAQGGKCEKCSRLGKECIFPSLAPKKRKLARRTRVSEMEAKIDGLVMLLSGQQPKANNDLVSLDTGHRPSDLPPTPCSQDSMPISASSCSLNVSRGATLSSASVLEPNRSKFHTIPASILSTCQTELTVEEANGFLDSFREMLQYLPFMALPSHIRAEDLLREKPFLYSCIMAVSCESRSMRTLLGNDLTQYLMNQILVKGEKSLDLLLGTIAYTAWYIHKCDLAHQLATMLQIAMALVCDLGLNRPKHLGSNHQMFFNAIQLNEPMKDPLDKLLDLVLPTMEEQRALIGYFYLSSVVSTHFQRVEPLRMVPHLDDCIRNLQEKPEYPSDISLACQARLQSIAQRLTQMHPPSAINPLRVAAPINLYVSAMRAQLQEVQKEFANQLEQEPILLMHFRGVEVNILEIGLSRTSSVAAYSNHDWERMEVLHGCLEAVEGLFEQFLSIHGEGVRRIPLSTFALLGNAIVTLHKLSTFEFQDWDLNYVRQRLNFGEVLGRVIAWFDAAQNAVSPNYGETFSRTARSIGRIKTWYDRRTIPGSERQDVVPQETSGQDFALPDEGFDVWNQYWLDEMLGPWAYQPNFGVT